MSCEDSREATGGCFALRNGGYFSLKNGGYRSLNDGGSAHARGLAKFCFGHVWHDSGEPGNYINWFRLILS